MGKLADNIQEILVETCHSRFLYIGRNPAEKGVSDPAGDASDGVAIARDLRGLRASPVQSKRCSSRISKIFLERVLCENGLRRDLFGFR
jgi:hypothetical protein